MRPRTSHTTHLTPLILHHPSHTTQITPPILHHPSHTAHLAPPISHHPSHTAHTPPILRILSASTRAKNPSHTTHLTAQLISHHPSCTNTTTHLTLRHPSCTTSQTTISHHPSHSKGLSPPRRRFRAQPRASGDRASTHKAVFGVIATNPKSATAVSPLRGGGPGIVSESCMLTMHRCYACFGSAVSCRR